MQHVEMQPVGQSCRCWRGVWGESGKEVVQSHARVHPGIVPIFPSVQIRPKYRVCCKPQALFTVSTAQFGSKCPLGEEKQGCGRLASAEPPSRELHTGASPRGPAASTDISWLLFYESKPRGKEAVGSQQSVRRAFEGLCWKRMMVFSNTFKLDLLNLFIYLVGFTCSFCVRFC